MTHLQPAISNTEVIPHIESRIFDEHPDAQLAVGIVAVGNEVQPDLEREFQGYTLLRGNVYARQQDYMSVDALNDDGTETDEDDVRSVHFVVQENVVTSARVVGAMRLIVKSREHPGLLPIEDHYPEAFADGPAPIWSTECSRLIGRHEDSKLQRTLKWSQFTAGVSYIRQNRLGPVFGVVHPAFARGLNMEGFPAHPLAEPKFVPEINSKKQPIRVDMETLTEKIEDDNADLFRAVAAAQNSFVYSGSISGLINREAVA